MNEIVNVLGTDITVKMYKGQRVVTFRDIDTVHNRPDGTASRNFRTNRDRFVEGKHYYKISSDEIRRTNLFDIPDKSTSDYALITERGYLMLVKSFTDELAWEVQERLVDSYFRVRQIVDEELSPEMQVLSRMVNQMMVAEMERNKMQKQIEQTQQSVDNIKEAVMPVTDNWREEITRKFNRIQKGCNCDFKLLRTEMYNLLDSRAGVDTKSRLTRKQNRMKEQGATKTAINKVNRMDIIEEDKKLREIFSKIVSEYEIRYCA